MQVASPTGKDETSGGFSSITVTEILAWNEFIGVVREEFYIPSQHYEVVRVTV
jgi:hypothetical protein